MPTNTQSCGALPSLARMTGRWSCKRKRSRAEPSCQCATFCAGPRRSPLHPMACTCCNAISTDEHDPPVPVIGGLRQGSRVATGAWLIHGVPSLLSRGCLLDVLAVDE